MCDVTPLLLLCSVVCDSLWLHGLQPTRLLSPWDFPGKNTGVGRHFLLQGIFPIQEHPSLLKPISWCGRQILQSISLLLSPCIVTSLPPQPWMPIDVVHFSPKLPVGTTTWPLSCPVRRPTTMPWCPQVSTSLYFWGCPSLTARLWWCSSYSARQTDAMPCWVLCGDLGAPSGSCRGSDHMQCLLHNP